MFSKLQGVVINSILIVMTASISGIMLHELAHFLAAKLLGVGAIFYSDNIVLRKSEDLEKMMIAVSGPLFSLIFGVIIILISYQIKKASILKLFLIWFGLYNVASFLGYTLISPFVRVGDTGIVMQYFNIPISIRFFIAVLSYLILRYIFPLFTDSFIVYVDEKKEDLSKEIFIHPLLISTVVIIIISQPLPTWISILPILFVPFSFIGIIKKYKKTYTRPFTDVYVIKKIHPALVLLCVSVILAFIFFK